MGESATEFLFERKKKPGSKGKSGEPKRRDWSKRFVAANCDVADLEECVGGNSGNKEGDAHRNGAIGNGEPLARRRSGFR